MPNVTSTTSKTRRRKDSKWRLRDPIRIKRQLQPQAARNVTQVNSIRTSIKWTRKKRWMSLLKRIFQLIEIENS